jgi:hypothetical protein
MAAEINSIETYDRVNNKESVTEKLKLFEREETPVYGSAKKVAARNLYEEWLEDSMNAVPSNTAILQGDEIGAAEAQTLPSRRGNHTQIYKKTYSVSRSAQQVAPYGYDNELVRLRGREVKNMRRTIEQSLVGNSASQASAGGTGGLMAGLESIISTNASRGAGGAGTGWNSGTKLFAAPTDGTQRVLDETTVFNDVIKLAYDNGYPIKNGRMIMGNSAVVDRISKTFTGNQSRQTEDKNKVNNYIDMIQSTMGDTFIVKRNPRVRQRTLLIVDMSEIELRTVQDIKYKTLPMTHDAERETLIAELTMICREKAQIVIADLTT